MHHSFIAGVGRVFTWGYGSDEQLANNENKGRCVNMIQLYIMSLSDLPILAQLGFYQSPASGGGCVTGQASEDDSMWSPSHGLHSGPWLGTR